MKRKLKLAILCTLLAGPGFADPLNQAFYYDPTDGTMEDAIWLTSDAKVKLYNDSGTNNAAFGVRLTAGQLTGTIYESAVPSTTATLFRTFCIEDDITFNPGDNYEYYVSVDRRAYRGYAPLSSDFGDPVSAVTEYFYDQYRLGTGTVALADLREIIWYAEGEITSLSPANSDRYEAAKDLVGEGDAKHTWALNVWTLEYNSQADAWKAIDRQSQLVTVVPVPGAILLGFLGLGYAGMRLRKVA